MTFEDIEEAPQSCRIEFYLREYQSLWLEYIAADRQAGFTRMLVDAPGGCGKTTVFATLAKREVDSGGRVLVLENRDRLVEQTADRIRKETGLEVEIERADDMASPTARVVVASVQTLGRVNRLTGFPDNHFTLVIPDECHHSLAPQWRRIIRYFHYGEASLNEEWVCPDDGTYAPKATIVGFTATPDIGDKKNLGEIFHKFSARYSYLEAVNDGWLVGPITENIPVKVDLRKFKTGRTPNGSDFKPQDLTKTLIPIIEELAKQVVERAAKRKTIAFVPSIECARLLAEAIGRLGLKSIFVSGECLDVDEKTDDFARSGAGTVLCNAALYVEGADFPDIDCVAWFRATISRAFYIQGVYRGTRVLPGTVDGLGTAELRRAAIAASAKPNLLILDPLFVSDRIDLCDAYDLFTDKPEVKAKMKEEGKLTPEAAEKAERDFIAALEKAAKKHARKQARVINPLAWAVSLGDAKLATYVPETSMDARPVTPAQANLLRQHHIDVDKIGCFGLASKIIGTILTRHTLKLATVGQLDFLHKLGVPDEQAATMSAVEASKTIDAIKRDRGWK